MNHVCEIWITRSVLIGCSFTSWRHESRDKKKFSYTSGHLDQHFSRGVHFFFVEVRFCACVWDLKYAQHSDWLFHTPHDVMNHVTKEIYIKRAFWNFRIPVVIWTNILVEDSKHFSRGVHFFFVEVRFCACVWDLKYAQHSDWLFHTPHDVMNHVTKEIYIKRAFWNFRIPVVIWTNILVEDSTFYMLYYIYIYIYIYIGGPKLFWVHGCEIWITRSLQIGSFIHSMTS